MVKTINIYLDEQEYYNLKEKKGKLTWKEYLIKE
tara:strand:- start:5928 stop:6029 length:102 start_codon:yes stop_codon:yes gene_type:complete